MDECIEKLAESGGGGPGECRYLLIIFENTIAEFMERKRCSDLFAKYGFH